MFDKALYYPEGESINIAVFQTSFLFKFLKFTNGTRNCDTWGENIFYNSLQNKQLDFSNGKIRNFAYIFQFKIAKDH